MYLEDAFGSLVIGNDLSLWKSHIANWPGHHPICVHATGQRLSAVLMLGMLYEKHIHVCHVSFKEDIELIRDAKAKGLKVTCETTPHHLVFAEKVCFPPLFPSPSLVPLLIYPFKSRVQFIHLII